MILSLKARQYFQMLQSKVIQGLTKSITGRPYFLEDDPFMKNYEMIRMVWHDGVSIKKACSTFSLLSTAVPTAPISAGVRCPPHCNQLNA